MENLLKVAVTIIFSIIFALGGFQPMAGNHSNVARGQAGSGSQIGNAEQAESGTVLLLVAGSSSPSKSGSCTTCRLRVISFRSAPVVG